MITFYKDVGNIAKRYGVGVWRKGWRRRRM